MLERSFVLGVDHHATSVALREQLTRMETDDLLEHLHGQAVDEAMLLSTCNRYELYGVARDGVDIQAEIRRFLLEKTEIPATDFDRVAYFKQGPEMVQHGFAVASSLESMVLGEPQILGQVKQAYEQARTAGTVRGFLDRYCTAALRTGKLVRAETDIARQPVSIASVAVKLAEGIFGDLAHKTVLLVGAGDMGVTAARHLKRAGVKDLFITNRNIQRAVQVAEPLQAGVLPFVQMEEALARADVVVSSTASEDFVITPPMVEAALQKRRQQPVFLIDIAVPRDIDPVVHDINNCFLYDIDQLGDVVAENGIRRQGSMLAAQDIVKKEVDTFIEWTDLQKKSHIIKNLREYFNDVRKDVLAQYDTPEAEQATRLLVNKLLHHPTMMMRSQEVGIDEAARFIEAAFAIKCSRHRVACTFVEEPEKKSRCPLARFLSL